MTSGGKRASQGSKEYLESIIEVMPDRVKANELSEALKFDELKYMLVKQPINDDGILGLTQISEFVL